MAKTSKLMDIYHRLYKHFGPQHWWPGESRFEIIVGAILTQNTSWSNVAKAIENLKKHDALNPKKLYNADLTQLAEWIRPAGYFNIKAQRLRHFLRWLFERFDGDVDAPEHLSASQLRHELLAIKGIGPETADSICLYAYQKPIFVVDAYTARILTRHGLIWPEAGYEEIQHFFESQLEKEVALFNEFHALLVCLGKNYCKPTPKCLGCPLEDLPHTIENR